MDSLRRILLGWLADPRLMGGFYFLWSFMLGGMFGLKALFSPRPVNRLVDLPDHEDQAFAPPPEASAAFLVTGIGLCILGTFRVWHFLVLWLTGFMAGFVPAELGFRHWLSGRPARRVTLWAHRFRRLGRRSESLAILELYAGLEAGSYETRGALESLLRGRLGAVLAEEPAYPLALADSLSAVGRVAEVARLFVAIFGLDSGQGDDPTRLRDLLLKRVAGLAEPYGVRYVLNLVSSVTQCGFPLFGARLLEAYFGWPPPILLAAEETAAPRAVQSSSLGLEIALQYVETASRLGLKDLKAAIFESCLGLGSGDYTRPAILARAVHRLRQLPADVALPLGLLFAIDLVEEERQSEAESLVAAWLGSPDLRQLDALLADPGNELSAEQKLGIVRLVALALLNAGRPAEAISLLENRLQLRPPDYRSPRSLRKRLQLFSVAIAIAWVVTLGRALCEVQRFGEALKLIESFLWLGRRLYRKPGKLGRILHDRLYPLAPEMRIVVLRHLVRVLFFLRRRREALAVQEAFLHLGPQAFAAGELSSALETGLRGVSATLGSFFLKDLVEALDVVGRTDDAGLVLDLWVRSWLRPGMPGAAATIDPTVLCDLFDAWLRHAGSKEPEEILALCRFFVPLLRQTLADTAIALADRSRFVASTQDLRRHLVDTGRALAERERALEREAALHLEVLLWDLELGRRIVLERLLAGATESLVDAAGLAAGWSLGTDRELPPTGSSPFEALAALCLTGSPGSTAPPAAHLGAPEPPAWLDEARQITRRGLRAEDLERLLSPSTVLVRALFLADGRLTWTALERAPAGISLSGHWTGDFLDRHRLRWLNVFHDFQLAVTWARLSRPPRGWCRAILPHLQEVERRLAAGEPAKLEAAVSTLVAVARRQGPGATTADLLGILGRLPLNEPVWTGEHTACFTALWKRLVRYVAALEQDANFRPASFHQERQRITAQALQEMAEIWRLDFLVPSLDRTPTDLILQADDVLHETPLACLPVAGVPLCRRVRSVRQSIDLLVTELQQEIERQAEPGGERLMTLSWFDPEDRLGVLQGNVLLHRGQARIADRFGLEWYSAGVRPPGSIGSLRHGLERYGGFRAVTVCGHGHADLGVKLVDPVPWRGQGWPLDQIELLLLVSCSVGRLRENGSRDVEGLAVDLAVNRARSILCCRWPVHAGAAAMFANAVLERYLELGVHAGPSEGNLRARALNEIRQEFYARGTDDPGGIDLNTVAAFELFGLG